MAENKPTFEAFVKAHSQVLLRTAYFLVWDETEAEDLVQETFVQVSRRWKRVAGMEHPLAYSRRILINRAIGSSPRRARMRSELNSAGHLGMSVTADVAEGPDADELAVRDGLAVALSRLNPRQRTVVVLRYYADLSEAEIAETLGCSVGTVKSNASRGLAELRRTLRSFEPRSV
jgi:RNA polymerase sigma-70 factor (sigma-E family)